MPLTLIHDCVVVACHAHPLDVPTVIVPEPPAPVWVRLVGVNVYAQAVWVTVKVRPAIVRSPVRCVEKVLGATVKVADPAPEPVAPPVTVIHAALVAAVQAQPVVVATVADPFPPAADTVWLVGDTVKVHVDVFCVTLNVWPPIVMVPVRGCAAELAVTLNVTGPLPVPLAPPEIVSQLALLTAVQAHPAPTVTLVCPEPLAAPTVALVGESVTEQTTPAWVTVKIWPPIVSAPERDCVDVFAAAAKFTVAVLLPLAAPLTVSHPPALLVAVHAQPVGVVIVVDPTPPPATTCWLVGARL